MTIRFPLGLRDTAETKLIENFVSEKELVLLFSKDEVTSSTNTGLEFIAFAFQDELKKFCHRARILPNLVLGGGIQDRKAFARELEITVYVVDRSGGPTSINMPFVAVYS